MDSSDSPRLGWIGLGSMGLAMAVNIQKHIQQQQGRLPPLKYWNRTLARGKPLQDLGAMACAKIADLVQTCDVIFISVSDDTALTSITTSIQSSGSIASKIFVDTTTIHPSTTTSICASFVDQKATYLAAPVFGATPVAEAGKLLVALAGDPAAISTISPFLTGVIARRVIQVGTTPSQALLLKTTSNFLTAGLMTLFSEAHTLAEKTGLPSHILEDLVEENFGAYCLGVSRRLTSGTYFPAEGQAPPSGLELGIKDVGHAVGLARENDMQLRIGAMYLEAAEEAKKYGEERGRRCDSSAIFGVVRQRAGLGFENEAVKERDGSTRQ
ncbi:6-phosphogluconate dehydrogenase nad-binding [Curvularia clavata]|uniref:6-phosphogluconate dehydrogenase nad-binding n=1 Tax=Curvularia clavata TaxID=95742 RepID=A0A9Q8Z2G4_CURCL|nr:6-phosphogluconate dehydrogenase nad-binding [Curvularia clavata]